MKGEGVFLKICMDWLGNGVGVGNRERGQK